MLPLQKFKDYIRQNSLFTATDKILIAVSGGKDSVLMAHLFKLAGYSFGIAHCNFNLRADESQRDENFVKMLAAALEVPFHVTHFKTKAYAAEHKISTQMAARDLRYGWFENIRQTHQYKYIALAQHQNDAVETVLLNLVRGTGIAGLHGILPKRDHLIRPLLFLSREEINQFIATHPIDFVEDSSNLTDTYARNKLRLNVVPYLKEINPNLEQTFAYNIQRFTETEMVLQQAIDNLRSEITNQRQDEVYFNLERLKNLNPQRLMLYELLKPFNFTEAVVAELLQALNKQSGTSFYSHTHRATVNREELIISVIAGENVHSAVLIHPKDTFLDLPHHQLILSYFDGSSSIEKQKDKAYIDADKLIFPLVVRTRQEGDRFMPLGMKTFKKLSDFLIDEKIPLPQKDSIPILVNGNGELIWIAGLRPDNRYKVTATTKKVAIFELKFK